eukprot:1503296-Rhodomonas_salina.2
MPARKPPRCADMSTPTEKEKRPMKRKESEKESMSIFFCKSPSSRHIPVMYATCPPDPAPRVLRPRHVPRHTIAHRRLELRDIVAHLTHQEPVMRHEQIDGGQHARPEHCMFTTAAACVM